MYPGFTLIVIDEFLIENSNKISDKFLDAFNLFYDYVQTVHQIVGLIISKESAYWLIHWAIKPG